MGERTQVVGCFRRVERGREGSEDLGEDVGEWPGRAACVGLGWCGPASCEDSGGVVWEAGAVPGGLALGAKSIVLIG